MAIAVLINQGVVEDDLIDIVQHVAAAILPNHASAVKAGNPAPSQSSSTGTETQSSLLQNLLGTWTGTVRTWQGSIPLALTIQPDGDIHVKLGSQLETLLTTVPPFIKERRLVGMFTGTMPTPEVEDYADKIGLTLVLRQGRLLGEALAFNDMDFDPFAGKPNFTISSYVDLAKSNRVK